MRKKEQINEQGRSMVEMLGTLAIMGVLAVGGIAGYRYAMDKMNANTIIDEVRKRAVTASQQRLIGQSINLNEYGATEIQKFPVVHTNDVDGDTAFFSLSVSNVPKGICDKVIQDKLRTVSEVWLNTNTDVTDGGDCSEGDENTIEFVFANTLDASAVPTPPGPCESGSFLQYDNECQEDTTPDTCTATQFWNNGVCSECPTETTMSVAGDNTSASTCQICPDARLSHRYKVCLYCPNDWTMCKKTCCPPGQGCNYNAENGECVTLACTDTSCGEGQICDPVTGQCQTGNCHDNTECDKLYPGQGYFCNLSVSTTNKNCEHKPGVGTCQSATLQEANGVQTAGDKTVYRSASAMNWWSAENFCKAIGEAGKGTGQLVDPSTHCSNWSTIKSSGSGGCSELAISGSSHYHWIKRLNNSCEAFFVNVGWNGVGVSGREYDGNYALCE